jgi:tRNA pseudouridine38-40 synthase
MSRYFLEIAYDGTNYCGWQIQENANSVQAEVEKVLSHLYSNQKIDVTGCGRTDTGVHAKQFFLHLDLNDLIFSREDFIFKLNRMLPVDIAAYALYDVSDEAHARYDADSRTYEYHIHQQKNPFLRKYSWNITLPLDIAAMNAAADQLKNYSDFAAFCKTHAASKTTICKIYHAQWELNDGRLVFTISADRFLRNMVRAIVGTMILCGKGLLSTEGFCEIIESKNRSSAGESVPASGLHLTKVTYPYLSGVKR